MRLFDVNVLVNAHRAEQAHHRLALETLERAALDPAPFALSEFVLSAFVRIVTDARLGASVTLDEAMLACDSLRERENARVVRPGPSHWKVFAHLCRATGARGSLVPDAYHAALAIEHGCEWVSFDRGFARFPGLRWWNPAAGERSAAR